MQTAADVCARVYLMPWNMLPSRFCAIVFWLIVHLRAVEDHIFAQLSLHRTDDRRMRSDIPNPVHIPREELVHIHDPAFVHIVVEFIPDAIDFLPTHLNTLPAQHRAQHHESLSFHVRVLFLVILKLFSHEGHVRSAP